MLFKGGEIFSGKREEDSADFSHMSLEQLRLVNIAGVVSSKDILKFTKMIFRATKGNSILYSSSMPDSSPTTSPY